MDDLKKNILVFVLISYITVCYGQGSPVGRILTQMKNVAGKPGQTVTFTAEIDKVNSGNFVVFEFTPPGQQSQTIWQENIPSKINLPVNVPGFTASVGYPKNTNTLKYNYTLTITLPSSLSSIREISVVYSAYFLLYPAFVKTSAYLTVVEPLKCSNSRGQVKQAGTEATLTCSTKYYGYRPPELQWFDNMTTLNTGPPTINATTGMISQTFRRTRVLSSDHNKQFDCVLHYPSTSGDATPPMYNDTCMDSFMVEYTTSTIIIEPRPQNANDVLNLNVGDVFNCTANGNPAPSYHFTCDQGIQITQGNLLKLESQFQRDDQVITCNCVAKQVNKPEKKKQFMFRVYAAGAKAGETAGDGVVGWHIAVGILVPIIIIAIIVGIVLYCVKSKYRRGDKKPSHPPEPVPTEEPFDDMLGRRTQSAAQPQGGFRGQYPANSSGPPSYRSSPIPSISKSNESLSKKSKVRRSQDELNKVPSNGRPLPRPRNRSVEDLTEGKQYNRPVPALRKSQEDLTRDPANINRPVPKLRKSQEDLTRGDPEQNMRKSLEDLTKSPYGAGAGRTTPGIRKSIEDLTQSPMANPSPKVGMHGGVPLPHLGQPPPVAPKPNTRPKSASEKDQTKQRKKSIDTVV